MALQAAYLCPVGVNKIILVQVQLWSTVHDVSDHPGQCEPLLSSRCVLVRFVVAIQELEKTKMTDD